MHDLDILIPVYNEHENILKVLDSLESHVKTSHQILICYDTDEDTTLPAVEKYRETNPINVVYVKNRGSGVRDAIVSGFASSKANAKIVFPADDLFNAGIIDTMYQHWLDGSSIVAASRFIKGGCMKGCPWLKDSLVRTAAFTLYHVGRLPTHDPTSGFKLFSNALLDNIDIETEEGWSFALELVAKCHRMNGKITEVPAIWIERISGKSRFKIMKWLPNYIKWYSHIFATTFIVNPYRFLSGQKNQYNKLDQSLEQKKKLVVK